MNDNTFDVEALAQEFGVSAAVMEQFVDRFAPARVPAGRYQEAADVLLFVHIPKTAGVSIGSSLHDAFDTFHGVEWNDVLKSFRGKTRNAVYNQTRGRSRQVIMGHYGWTELLIWRNHEMPMKCATILRDPVARVLSNYKYNCSSAHPDNVNFQARFPTIEDYVKVLPLDVQLTQAVGFVNSFENALQKFIQYYTFLGTTEYLSASLSHLGRSHGLPELKEYRKNVGQPRSDVEVTRTLRSLIENRSHNDGKIHRLISILYQDMA